MIALTFIGAVILNRRFEAVDNIFVNSPVTSNVTIVAGQIANTLINATSATVSLTGVTVNNTLIIAYGTRSANPAVPPTFTDSQGQAITVLEHDSSASSGGAGIYSGISAITGAFNGTHTITISTTDISQSGAISLYEIHGYKSFTGSSATSQILTTMVLTTVNLILGQVAIGAGGCAPVSGVGASLTWSGGGTTGSLIDDEVDNGNFCGLTGHLVAVFGTQDYGYARQGALTPTGTSLCGVILK